MHNVVFNILLRINLKKYNMKELNDNIPTSFRKYVIITNEGKYRVPYSYANDNFNNIDELNIGDKFSFGKNKKYLIRIE